MDALLKGLGRIEALLARSLNRAPRHGAGISPWHMWGNSQVIQDAVDPSGFTQATPGQLVRINYKRPETWHWVFAAKVLEFPTLPDTYAGTIQLVFDLTIGVGRSQLTMPAFEVFQWQWVAPGIPNLAVVRSSEAPQLPRFSNGTDPRSPLDNVISQIVAEDIQLEAKLLFAANPVDVSSIGTVAKVQVDAMFSPKVHVRPEWALFKFPGGEEG